jgi:hypothetical protein
VAGKNRNSAERGAKGKKGEPELEGANPGGLQGPIREWERVIGNLVVETEGGNAPPESLYYVWVSSMG